MPRRYVPPWERTRALTPTPVADAARGGGSSPYRLGKAFEASVRAQLQRRGYFVVRAGASKGKVDLLAVARDRPALFVQCKRRGDIGSAEWNQLFELAERYGGWPVLAMRTSERTTGYFRLDEAREFRKRGRPMTGFDPTSGQLAPPQLFAA